MKIGMYYALTLFFLDLNGVELEVVNKKISVNGKEASILAVSQPHGTLGLRSKKGELFDVILKNLIDVPTSIHWHGPIKGAFRPADAILPLRDYLRQRDMLIKNASAHILHMQKALSQMNLHLHNVISDITGSTGMAIIRSIVTGIKDPKVLASFRNERCRNSEMVC